MPFTTTNLNNMKNLEIEIRPHSISIQGGNIATKTSAAKEILKAALKALEKEPDFVAQHELVFNNEKK